MKFFLQIACLLLAYGLSFGLSKPMRELKEELKKEGLLQARSNNALKYAESSAMVVGGDPAPPGRYPYMAGLVDPTFSSLPFCGGSLIAPNVVLSAAHCPTPGIVTVGCQDQFNLTTPGCETFGVAEHFFFPGFDDSGFGLVNDYAVIVLDGVSANKPMDYLASSELDIPPGEELRLIGFGRTFFTGPQSAVLLEVDIGFIPADVCNEKYSILASSPPIDDSMVCAGTSGKNACNGDSGGPLSLVCEATGEDLQIGIVSWGVACATDQYPAVYAKVSFEIDFIRGIVEDQGHSLNTIDSLDDFCLVGGTQAPTAPTPPPTSFPTFPLAWTCPDIYYATYDGCDCNCGAPDPDCDVTEPPQTLFGCLGNEICVEGVCVTPGNNVTTFTPTVSPTRFPTVSPTKFPGVDPTPSPTDADSTPAPTSTGTGGGIDLDDEILLYILLALVVVLLVLVIVLLCLKKNKGQQTLEQKTTGGQLVAGDL